jgi:hypothetical protein
MQATVKAYNPPNQRLQGLFVIELSYTRNELSDFLVRASFKGGMMQHWGWSKKFTESIEPVDYPP